MKDSVNINHIEDGVDEGFGGYVTAEVVRDGANGPEVIERRVSHNLVVNAGKKQIWRMVQGTQTNLFDQMRIGTSAAAANSGQTNLLSPIASTINTVSSMTVSSGTRTAQWVISYPSGAGSITVNGISEVVLLNQNTSPGGSCMMRTTFTSVNKTTADKLKITYSCRIT